MSSSDLARQEGPASLKTGRAFHLAANNDDTRNLGRCATAEGKYVQHRVADFLTDLYKTFGQ